MPQTVLDLLRAYYEKRENTLLKREEEEVWQHARETFANLARLSKELYDAQRQEAIALRNQEIIDDEVFHTIERHLDLEEQRFQKSAE